MSSFEQAQPASRPAHVTAESTQRDVRSSEPRRAIGGGPTWSISTKELIGLCQRVGQSLKAGVEIRRVWQQESTRGNATHRQHIDSIFRHVAAGGTVADAMRACGGFFPRLTCQMVEIGEKTGQLDEVLLKLAKYYEQQEAMKRSFYLGIAWPMLQLGAATIIIAAVIWISGMIGSFMGTGQGVDILGLGLTGGWGAILFLLSVATVVGGVVLAINALLRGWFGGGPLRMAMRLPVLGTCLESFALSRLTWSFALGLESGMDARRVVELALSATQNAHYEQHTAEIVSGISHGQTFHDSFAQSNAFPSDFLFALETAEIAGATSESLLRLAKQYEEKAHEAMRYVTMACTAATFALVALIIIMAIGRLAMFVFQPYRDAMDMINNGV
ncbi:type II secretion system F family protein [Anatilimnocola floriformis]|uniref:type II secretion system F family protein n=1 Tax=Anatilimnocola floriformis TaxID=2948575 RepID=UPI0020C4D2B6|nr:type II secretion system F family protein [Anatilimnocola floriformis]